MAVYYRIYTEDGAIISKTSATTDDPSLGCITATSVPPPHNVISLKRVIAKVENINLTRTSLFLTPSSQSPVDDTLKLSILSRTGPGSLPQEPLALVAKLTASERSALKSDRSGFASTLELKTATSNIQYRKYMDSKFIFLTSGFL
jgi:hypothetical protein